jgi:hypothetical protein
MNPPKNLARLWELPDDELIALDKAIAAIIWRGTTHTISYELGRMVLEGDQRAELICAALSAVLGRDHCIRAYRSGDLGLSR